MGISNSGWERLETQLLREILAEEKLQTAELKKINRKLSKLVAPEVEGFIITRKGDSMPLPDPIPGETLQFSAATDPAGSALPAGVVPTWASSDQANAPVTADATGLNASVVLAQAIPVGESVTLTITASLPDGTAPSGTTSFTVAAAPPPEVTGFTITRTA